MSLCQILLKFIHQSRSYCDFSISHNGRCHHLDFSNSQNFIGLRGREGRDTYRAKFRQNRPIHCKDIAIFRFLKMAAAAYLDFQIRKLLLADGVWRAQMHHWTKFRQNRSIGWKIIRFFDFFQVDLFGAHLDHQQWVFGGLYHSAKFGYDQCSNFYNMNISIFGAFGWKTPTHTITERCSLII